MSNSIKAALVALVALSTASSAEAQMTTNAEPVPCGECVSCRKNGVDGHNGQSLSTGGPHSGTDHGCFTFSCAGHGLCQSAMLDLHLNDSQLEALFRDVERGSSSAIADLVAAYGEKVKINRERQAIQIVGCNEMSLMAHIPTTDAGLQAATHLSSALLALAVDRQ